mgnify:FL=1
MDYIEEEEGDGCGGGTYFTLFLLITGADGWLCNACMYVCISMSVCRYEGNNFLCLVSNASCLGTPSPSPSSTNNAAPLIAGIVCSLLVIAVITTCVICICRRRRRKTRHQPLTSHVNKVQLNTGVSTASNTDYGDHGNWRSI